MYVARWLRVLLVALVLALLATMAALVDPAAADTTTFNCGGPGLDATKGATYTNEASKATNYGTDTLVLTREGSGQKRYAFFECIVSGLPAGATVTSAALNITAKSGTNTTATVRVHQRTTDFAEGTLTWNTQGSPAFNATVLAQKTGFAFDERWSPSVGSVVTGNGTFRFALSRPTGQTTPQVQSFASDDHGTVAHRPTLTVNWTPPTPADQINLGLWRNKPIDSLNWRSDMNADEALFGAFQGHWRDYISADEAAPLHAVHEQALADGKKLHLFWKPWGGTTPAGVTAATFDAAFTDMAAHCDGNASTPLLDAECWLTIGHEYDNDPPYQNGTPGWTAADYRAMWDLAIARRDAVAPEVRLVWIMTGHGTSASGGFDPAKQADYIALYPDNTARRPDAIGHDPYIQCDTPAAELAERIEDRSEWFVANIANKPVVIGEFGPDLGGDLTACTAGGDRGTAQHRADAIDGVRTRLSGIAAAGVVEMTYFNGRSDYLEEPPSVDHTAFQNLKNATE